MDRRLLCSSSESAAARGEPAAAQPFPGPIYIPGVLARDHHLPGICRWQWGSVGNGLAVPSAAGVCVGARCGARFLTTSRTGGQAPSAVKVS